MLGGGVSNIGLGFTFTARDLASPSINRLGSNFQNLNNRVRSGAPMMMASFAGLAASASVMATGMAGIRGAFGLAQEAGEFGIALADVQSITRATSQELEGLHDSAIRAGILTQFDPTEAAEGLRNLGSNGVIARDATRALVPVLDLAAAGSIEVGEAADVAMAAVNAYSLSVDDITGVGDRLMRATQMSALRTNEYSVVLGRAASSGRQYGQTLNTVLVSLGAMRSAGIPATVATTAFREASRRLFTDVESGRIVTEQYGVALYDNAGRQRQLADIIHDLNGAMGDLTQEQRAQTISSIFHVRGSMAFNAIANYQTRVVRDGAEVTLRARDATDEFTRSLESASGTMGEFRERRLATFHGQMILLAGTMSTFKTVLGETFGPVFRPMVLAFTETVNALTRAWLAIPNVMRTFIAVSSLVISALAFIGGGIGTVVFGVGLMITIFGSALLVIGAVAAGIIAALIPVFAAFGVLVATGYAVYRAWQQNFGGLQDLTERWATRLRFIWRGIEQIFSRGYLGGSLLGEMLADRQSDLVKFLQGIERFVSNARQIWTGFQEGFQEAWRNLEPTFAALRQSIDRLGNEAMSMGGELISAANSVPTSQYEAFGQTLAQTVATGLRDVIRFAIVTTDVLTELLIVIRDPTFRSFVGIIRDLASAVGSLVDALGTLYGIAETVNPGSWFLALMQTVQGQDVTALPAFNEGGRRATLSERFSAFTGSELEAPVRPPSGAAQETAAGPTGRRGGSRDVRLNQELNQRIELRMNEDVLASQVNRIQNNQLARNGEMIDEGGRLQSVWEPE